MRLLLFFLAILAFLAGATTLTIAESAIHEIESFILFTIFAVLISGAGVVEAISQLRKEISADGGSHRRTDTG